MNSVIIADKMEADVESTLHAFCQESVWQIINVNIRLKYATEAFFTDEYLKACCDEEMYT